MFFFQVQEGFYIACDLGAFFKELWSYFRNFSFLISFFFHDIQGRIKEIWSFFFFMMYKDGSLKMSNKEIWFWACSDEINKDDEIKIVEI